MSTIGELVRGSVSSLFGRFRPPAGLSGEEIKGVKAERLEFGQRLVTMLKTIEAPADRIVREARTVFRELQNQPYTVKMPTPDGIAASVRERCDRGAIRPFCPACKKLGGIPGFYADTESGSDALRGSIPLHNEWWCPDHSVVIAWYSHRQERYEDGLPWPYPPPTSMVPRAAFAIGAHTDTYFEYTDGVLMGELALFVRDYIESATGNAVLDQPRIHA